MRAATIVDDNLTVREHPDPRPEAGEVLVAVRAAGLNAADLLQVKGFYPAPPGSPPDIPGMEFAGEVAAVGPSALRFSVGDRVMALVGGGAQAELAVVHERVLMPVPENVDWIAAGGFPEVFTTAHDALVTQARMQMGERVLIHGAAGGVGVAAVQLAHLAGARVTATVRAESLRQDVAALGAETVSAPEDFADHGPYDVILELVGAPNLGGNLDALAIGGRIVVIGIGAGAERRDRPARADDEARPAHGVDDACSPARGEGPVRAPPRDGGPPRPRRRASARAGGCELPTRPGPAGVRPLRRRP